jgi:DNA invertase Pin-like site-specific DNA recombinase
MATFGYGRVSIRDQDAQNQKLEIERAGYTMVYWCSDTMSGKVSTTQRLQFRELLTRIRDGETLVVSKLDRLGRDAQDIGATIKLLAARRIEVIVLQFGKLNLVPSARKMTLAVLGAEAELGCDLLVERTQAGLVRAKANGTALDRTTKATARDRAKIVESHAAGMSQQKIADQFKPGKATVFNVIGASKAAQAPASTADTKGPSRHQEGRQERQEACSGSCARRDRHGMARDHHGQPI